MTEKEMEHLIDCNSHWWYGAPKNYWDTRQIREVNSEELREIEKWLVNGKFEDLNRVDVIRLLREDLVILQVAVTHGHQYIYRVGSHPKAKTIDVMNLYAEVLRRLGE